MTSWYTVERGFITCEQTFDNFEEAELFAIAMSATTGDMWHVKFNYGYSL